SVVYFSTIEKASEVHLKASITYDQALQAVSFQKMEGNNKSAWTNISWFTGADITPDLNFIDKDLKSGDHYYRLAITDRDGFTAYSSVRKVRIRGGGSISVYPTLFSNELNIKGLKDYAGSEILISDQLGRIIFQSN